MLNKFNPYLGNLLILPNSKWYHRYEVPGTITFYFIALLVSITSPIALMVPSTCATLYNILSISAFRTLLHDVRKAHLL